MGMFDTLHFQCPKCGGTVSEQSKAGKCSLVDYGLADAPLLIIADINDEGNAGRLFCDHCEVSLELEVRFIAMPKIKGKDYEDEEFRVV